MAGATKNFDVVEVYEPNYAHIRKWVYMARKVIYINRASDPDAKVICVDWD